MDFVYVRKQDKHGLDIGAKQHVLRVAEVRPSGVLILQGRCGKCTAVHSSHCAPCHLPNIDAGMDWSLNRPPAAAACEQCGGEVDEQGNKLIFCDNCNSGWHLQCCQPPLSTVLRGTWVCNSCVQQKITLDAVKAAQQYNYSRATEQLPPEKYTTAEMRTRAVHGKLLKKRFPASGQQPAKYYLGQALFRGPRQSKNLVITYEDGDVKFTTLRILQQQQVEWLSEGTPVPPGVTLMTLEQAQTELLDRQRQHSTQQQHRAGRRGPGNNPSAVAGAVVSLPAHLAAAAATTEAVFTAAKSLASMAQPISSSISKCTLPGSWDLSKPAGVRSAMQLLMPGPLADKDCIRIANHVGKALSCQSAIPPYSEGLGFIPTAPEEVELLRQAVDFSKCSGFFDPFVGSGSIAQCLSTAGHTVLQNDLNPYWQHPSAVDALQPYNYDWVSSQVIVTSPPFEVLDVAAPLIALKAGAVACIHVPGHWLSSPSGARQTWLQQLAAEGRLHVIMGLPRGLAGRKCAWVLVFGTACIKHQLLTVVSDDMTVRYALA